MTDEEIVDLYWQRSERAIQATEEKYGSYCLTIASHMLADLQDAEESVNDTWLAAWNRIPPTRPQYLRAYLGKLCRSISVSRFRARASQKRGGGEITVALDELSECLQAPETLESQIGLQELTASIQRFLKRCPKRERVIFTARYFYVYPIEDIAKHLGMKAATVRTVLHRTRKKLREDLEKEGFQ